MTPPTPPTHVGVVVGSLATTSINRRLARRLAELAPPALDLREIDIAGLPVYSTDLDADPPSAAREFKAAIEAYDVLLFVTPESNRSIPGALKNALDWGSRPYGDNSWAGKAAAIIGTGLNGAGTAVAQAHLRSVLGYLEADLVSGPEMCLPWHEALLDDPGTTERLARYLAVLHDHNGLRGPDDRLTPCRDARVGR